MEKHKSKHYIGTLDLEIRGEFACFTRPEFKGERVSYEVITPSAARNVFQAIYYRSGLDYIIQRVDVLNPIAWASIRRNEVNALVTQNSNGVFIEEERMQRTGLILRDVAYIIHADLVINTETTKGQPQSIGDKHLEAFKERASSGQCFSYPYLGCREFSVSSFKLVDTENKNMPTPIKKSKDLGLMLLDRDYKSSDSDINAKPIFFHAFMKDGRITVPHPNSEKVYR